jgi:predicted RNase H-like nuclease (RuvC/YqgF family)
VGYPKKGRDILKPKTMKAYELKQSLLDRMEIETLTAKIRDLKIELSIKDLQIKSLKEDLEYSKQLTLIAKINNI